MRQRKRTLGCINGRSTRCPFKAKHTWNVECPLDRDELKGNFIITILLEEPSIADSILREWDAYSLATQDAIKVVLARFALAQAAQENAA